MNLDFASVWEMVSDLVPENDALIYFNAAFRSVSES